MRSRGEQFIGGKTTGERVRRYLEIWEARDYKTGIPDEVPAELAAANLAPSWKSIACAILRNDVLLLSLGFAPVVSRHYEQIKRHEISQRCNHRSPNRLRQKLLF